MNTELGTDSRIERLFGDDFELFDLILNRLLATWGGRGVIRPSDNPKWLWEKSETFNDYCTVIRNSPGGTDLCWECDREHAEIAGKQRKAIHYICNNGLLDVSVPIIINGQAIATIIFGQRRLANDPEFNAKAMTKLRQTEKALNLPDGALQKSWENTPQVTLEVVEKAKSDVARIAEFIAEIAADREELRLVASRSKEIKELLDRLALTNLSKRSPLSSYWNLVRKILPDLCQVLDIESGIILRGDNENENLFVVEAVFQNPKSIGDKITVPVQTWSTLSKAKTTYAKTVSEVSDMHLQHLHSQNDGKDREYVFIAEQIASGYDIRMIILFEDTTPAPFDSTAWLPLRDQEALFDIITSRLKLSYGAAIHYFERLLFENSRDRYLQDITHQLVGPLSGIKAHLENILESRIPVERYINTIESAYQQSTRIQHYANCIALAARPEHNIFSLEEARFIRYTNDSLVSELIDCGRSFLGESRLKGFNGPSVKTEYFQDFPTLWLDRRLFRILVMNLYDNAIKYSYTGSPITVTGNIQQNSVEIIFTNHGIPIPMNETEKIFSRSYRSEAAIEAQPLGTGIGLYLCRQIAELHNGSINAKPSVKSEYGNRVEIILTLPATTEH